MRMDLATRPLKEVMLIESFWVGHKSSISGKFVKEHGTDTEGKKSWKDTRRHLQAKDTLTLDSRPFRTV